MSFRRKCDCVLVFTISTFTMIVTISVSRFRADSSNMACRICAVRCEAVGLKP